MALYSGATHWLVIRQRYSTEIDSFTGVRINLTGDLFKKNDRISFIMFTKKQLKIKLVAKEILSIPSVHVGWNTFGISP